MLFKEDVVNRMGSWSGDIWSWKLIRGEEVLVMKAYKELVELQELLHGICPIVNSADLIIWPFDKSKCFIVRS